MPDLDPSARLDKLEKRMRMWKWALIANLFLFVGLLVGLGSIMLDLGRIHAHSLVITGEDDTPRASIKVDEQGCVRFQIMDKQGRPRAAMQVADSGAPSVFECDEKGQDTAILK